MATTNTDNNSSILSVSAASTVAKPSLSVEYIDRNRIQVKVKNISRYTSDTKFNVYVDNVLSMKNISKNQVSKDSGKINVYRKGANYLNAHKSYRIKIEAVRGKSKYGTSFNRSTGSNTYFSIKSGTQFYKIKNGKLIKAAKLSSSIVDEGILTTIKGATIEGKNISKNPYKLIKITHGKYKGLFIKESDKKATRITRTAYKARIVSDYGASMNGGRYVYGGSSYRATDCSGLVMLSYKQVGINLPHSASAMAGYGKAVSRSNMKPGDIIVMNGGSHVGMYVGNNKFVHAMNSYDGIKVQSISNLKYYSIQTIRRIIF
ncbi:MAG: C40 family peptidase [Oscillospiraceae bacterium]